MATAAAVFALGVLTVLMWKRKRVPRIKMVLALVGGTGLTAGVAGDAMTGGIEAASAWVGSLTSAAFGVAVPGLLAVVAVLIVIFDLKDDKKANLPALMSAIALPALLAAQGGLLGSLGHGLTGGLAGLAAQALSLITGGG